MAVRNFWIEADIDGRKTQLKGGPVRKDGGFDMTIYMRDKGDITAPIHVKGICYGDRLELRINNEAKTIFTLNTER